MKSIAKTLFVCALLLLSTACGNPAPGTAPTPSVATEAPRDPVVTGKLEAPPFAVAGEAAGLLLVWYDEAGAAHPAGSRADVPEAQRQRVRVDSLDVAPDKRLDPAFVYIADLRKARADGSYEVRKVEREAFELFVVKNQPSDAHEALAKTSDVIIYGASWCGACKQAARFLSQKGVPFVEKDIEKEPAARSEMLTKAKAQGVSTSGIPVIDVRGKLLGGFDPGAVERLLATK
jgi:glutaredoxin